MSADEVEELRDIAVYELNHGAHGSFLTAFLVAFLKADSENIQILAPAMKTFVEKYGLKDMSKGGS